MVERVGGGLAGGVGFGMWEWRGVGRRCLSHSEALMPFGISYKRLLHAFFREGLRA